MQELSNIEIDNRIRIGVGGPLYFEFIYDYDDTYGKSYRCSKRLADEVFNYCKSDRKPTIQNPLKSCPCVVYKGEVVFILDMEKKESEFQQFFFEKGHFELYGDRYCENSLNKSMGYYDM